MWKGLALLGVQNAKLILDRRAATFAYFLAAGAVGFLAICFALIALFAWLTRWWGAPLAASALALGLFIIAGVIWAIGANRQNQAKAQKAAFVTSAAIAMPVISKTLFRKPKITPLTLAAVTLAAFVIGRRMKSR